MLPQETAHLLFDVEVEDRACGCKDTENIEQLPYTNKFTQGRGLG